MFVKHIRNGNFPVETTYECKSYKIEPLEALDSDSDDLLIITVDGDETFEVNKSGDELYIMNGNGRTIDSYDFREPAVVELKVGIDIFDGTNSGSVSVS